MALCQKCGTQIDVATNICPACGTAAAATGAPQRPAPPFPGPAQGQQAPGQQGAGQWSSSPFAQAANNTAGYADPNDVQENKVMALLAYLGILFLIPLLTGTVKTSPFTKYHTNQGIILFIVEIVYGVAYAIVATILAFIPIIGALIAGLLSLFYLVFLVFIILGIINALNGKLQPLPLIGGIQLLK
ncbi:MAG: hypothetical protein LBP24_04880 [Coriobacteriales bacterium]|jgi:uncharacterized membrane protein|nr:hypothetical protein [Coriobacteriales bacterium]